MASTSGVTRYPILIQSCISIWAIGNEVKGGEDSWGPHFSVGVVVDGGPSLERVKFQWDGGPRAIFF